IVLEAVGVFGYVEQFCRAGVTIPIIGFGSALAKGAIKGAEQGLLQAVTGGLIGASAGLASAILFGFIFSIIFRSHSKKT
ncbi:MAG: SpoVA/SpoVAEb family sporulation membrane protein, partial [Clostridia bacterium]